MADTQQEALNAAKQKLAARFGGSGRVGGMRRKKKTVHKAATGDDKRLQSTIKRLGMTNIPAVEEVNMFKDDGSVIHFKQPKVQASIGANTYVVSGAAEQKGLQELLPEIITQLGPDSLMNLRKIAEQMSKEVSSKKGEAGDSDDDVPSGNFDEAAAEA